MTKIIDKIISFRKKARRIKVDNIPVEESPNAVHPIVSQLPREFFYSFEFFPPKTEAGLDNLLTRIDRMSNRLDPLFVDVTWGESGSTSVRSIAVASHAQKYCGVDALLHLTCTGMTKDQIASILRQVKSHGVQNILALRGDPPRGKPSWCKDDVSGGECDRAIDLIKLIRELHGDYFCIGCAGHPEGHPSSVSQEVELMHLKEKIEAGADFVITQFFYDADIFLDYVQKCRAVGIHCPILPGILPIQSYASFTRMTSFFNISVPEYVMKRLDPVKEDDEAVKDIGCEIAIDIATKILTAPLDKGGMDGIHFYTLNLERSVTRILMSMNAVSPLSLNGDYEAKQDGTMEQPSPSLGPIAPSRRQLPWRPSAMERREKEDVRPINWANRPKSYLMRTDDWDEFPNGRWGDSTSPAFGELSDLSHFYSFSLGTEEDRLAMLGPEPIVPQDVYEVFAKYVEGKVPHLPWCETTLKPESFTIQSKLADLNRSGFLTINSQPAINGLESNNPIFGWGGPGGYVYQKGYIECFTSPENLPLLLDMVSKQKSLNLYAMDNFGNGIREGVEEGGVTALTWGVFPNREILQPTIFDPDTFVIWAEEAFSLWTNMWLNLYEFGSESYELIEYIRDNYYLVAIIDNDFVSTTKGSLCEKILEAKNILRTNTLPPHHEQINIQ